MEDRWMAVVNVFAASKKAGSVWKNAAVMLQEAGVSFKARFTGGKLNAMALSHKSACEGYRKFIAVGGDGTIHDVLNGISAFVDSTQGTSFSDFTIAVIPVGSGNDWVKSAGVSRDIGEAVSLIAEERLKRQDVVRVSLLETSDIEAEPLAVSYMANIAGVGLDARVCEIVNRKKGQGRRGSQLYLSSLLYCISHRIPVSASVVCDGVEVFNGQYLSIAFGTGKYSGGGMRQTPLAIIDDGLIDVTVIPDIPLWTIVKEVKRLFDGSFHEVKELAQARCRKVVVMPAKVADAEPIEVDGEVLGHAPVSLEVLDSQINIISGL